MEFWLITGAIGLLVAAMLIAALVRRGREATAAEPAAAYDLRVYRDQLDEVGRDLARGVISAEDAERARTEISRKILEADKALQASRTTTAAPPALSYAAAGLMALVLLGGSYWLYSGFGAPGYADLPLQKRIDEAAELRATRPDQAAAEARMPAPAPVNADPKHLELVERLRTAVAEHPDDLRGQKLLAGNAAALGSFAEAYGAQIKVIELKGEDATADDYAMLADLMVLAAGGYVSPEAETALKRALERDPRNGTARYYSGLMFAQTGRPDLTFRLWSQLLEEGPENAPWIAPIRGQIEELAMVAGVEYTQPSPVRGPGAPALAGPTAEDMEAAGEMTPEERMQMVRGMVEQLGERLASEGGSPEEWARMIGALGVLGETERAAAIWDEAQQVFGAEPGALDIVRGAARQAGVAE